MHREKHLFSRVVDLDNLYRGFLGASHGRRDRPEVREFEYHLETCLWAVRRELEAGVYEWGPFRRFWIRDPKRREIRAAPFRDRVVHHAIFNVLDPIFRRGFIADSYACIPGRGTHLAVQRYRAFVRACAGRGYRVQCDIKSYFASVDHGVLMARLSRRVGDDRVLDLLWRLVEHGAEHPGRGMPIGSLTSQLFANVYLDALDHFVKEELRVRHYIRYMDDFLLLTPDRAAARDRLKCVRAFLRDRLLLELNPRRVIVAPLSAPCDLLGYVHHADGRVRVRRRSVLRLWRRLPALQRRVVAGEIDRATAHASVASWFGLAGHANAFRLSRSIMTRRDVDNIGKRLLVQSLCRDGSRHRSPRAMRIGSGRTRA
ncbi:reverse transcriptase/maturase family protein [Candidatus Binatia bacterium]|nr:reverse transcriptase/maturase family protein [Candidatus Binatia bacterium]